MIAETAAVSNKSRNGRLWMSFILRCEVNKFQSVPWYFIWCIVLISNRILGGACEILAMLCHC